MCICICGFSLWILNPFLRTSRRQQQVLPSFIVCYPSVANTISYNAFKFCMHTKNLQVGLGMQRGSSSPPGSMCANRHAPTEEKNTPVPPIPCTSRQPQLQPQLLFSLQTTGHLGCQLCLVVWMSPSCFVSLSHRLSLPLQYTLI